MSLDSSPQTKNNHDNHATYRADIDGLRALAALLVVFFHAFPTIIPGGFIGVDIFFIISGFLISHIIFENLENNEFSFLDFYNRRIKRIFPALLLVLITCLFFGWFYLLPNDYEFIGKHIAGGASFLANFVLIHEVGYFDSASETKPLLHLWALGIEEQFYILFPMLTWFIWKQKINFLRIITITAITSFIINIIWVQYDEMGVFYSPTTRFWELMMGSLLAYVQLFKHNSMDVMNKKVEKWVHPFTISNVQSWVGFLLIMIGVFALTKEHIYPWFYALLPTFGATLIIRGGENAWFNRVVLSHPIAIWFGLISYPLYLWHWPLLSFAHIFQCETPSLMIRIMIVCASILLAWGTFHFIEKPIRFGKKYKAQKSLVLIFAMIIVGTTGYGCYQYHWFSQKFPKIIHDLNQGENEADYSRHFFRQGKCLLFKEQNFGDFKPCINVADSSKKTMVLWGDSHAAHLYPGYKYYFSKHYNIIQLTANTCPPILGNDFNCVDNCRDNCRDINNYVIHYIEKTKPYKVVLGGAWPDPRYAPLDIENLKATILKLKKIGIKQIDLIGPVPRWKDSLSKQIFNYWRLNGSNTIIPSRMNFGLEKGFVEMDLVMSKLAHELKINYISPEKIMCNKDGCLTKFGDNTTHLTSYDYGHLTTKASQFLVSHFPLN
jgi:peptidoglycan/LPS O-acetylase OafA/YrhL